jgi:hypothetical protein
MCVLFHLLKKCLTTISPLQPSKSDERRFPYASAGDRRNFERPKRLMDRPSRNIDLREAGFVAHTRRELFKTLQPVRPDKKASEVRRE